MGVSVLEYTPRKGIKRLEEVLPKLYLLKIMSTKSFDLNYSISFLILMFLSPICSNSYILDQKRRLKYNFQMRYLQNELKIYMLLSHVSIYRAILRNKKITFEEK